MSFAVVGVSKLGGRGLFANGHFTKGEVLLRERPLVALQSLDNRQYVPTCGCCFGFVGSFQSHLKLLTEEVDRSEMSHTFDQEEANIPGAIFAPIVPCLMGCGELYCSASCRDQHWARGHRLLCVGPIPEQEAAEHPLVLHKMHGVRTNEIFLLVADVVALIMTTYENNGGDMQAAMRPFRDFVQLPWWDVATNPDPTSDPLAFKQMLKDLVMEASSLLSRAICRPGCEMLFIPEFFAAVIGMFEQNNVGIRLASPINHVICSLQTGIASDPVFLQQYSYVQHAYIPLLAKILQDWEEGEEEEEGAEEEEEEKEPVAMHVDDEEEEEAGCHCASSSNGHAHQHHNHTTPGAATPATSSSLPPLDLVSKCQALGKEAGLFPALDGTALFTLICCMNHSCAPNCEVRWIGGSFGHPLIAELVALQPISLAEELFQSYVKIELPVEERREALKDYGFQCQCSKCLAEIKA